MEDYASFLPPGFRFDPTDEELVGYFLYRKASDLPCNPSIVPELDFYLTDPWKLNDKAFLSQNQYYFFSRRIENRATEQGHWEEQDINEVILTCCGKIIGIKKYLVFYTDDALKERQRNWFMEEYHLCSDLSSRYCRKRRNGPLDLNDWMLCRVHYSKTDFGGIFCHLQNGGSHEVELSLVDETFLSMEDEDQDEVNFPW